MNNSKRSCWLIALQKGLRKCLFAHGLLTHLLIAVRIQHQTFFYFTFIEWQNAVFSFRWHSSCCHCCLQLFTVVSDQPSPYLPYILCLLTVHDEGAVSPALRARSSEPICEITWILFEIQFWWYLCSESWKWRSLPLYLSFGLCSGVQCKLLIGENIQLFVCHERIFDFGHEQHLLCEMSKDLRTIIKLYVILHNI